ncbi:MAG: phage holin family protein [Chloroflexi bacterium]|nr:MAG: phage holin family protein [Chloroflexota bacterium]
MVKFFLRWLINAVALYVAVVVVQNATGGITLQNDSWLTYVLAALIFGFVNALLRPLLTILTCPLIILTLGLFTLIINTFLFYLVGIIGSWFGVGYTLSSFWDALLGAVIVSVVSFALSLIFKDELKERPRWREQH